MPVSEEIKAPGFDTHHFNPKKAEAPKPTPAVPPQQRNYAQPPTVALIGAGGCGINLTRAITMDDSVNALLDEVLLLDASLANVDQSRKHETIHVIANGHGGGKNQRRNLEEIRRNLNQFGHLPQADVCIVLCGISGASGSTIGTVLIDNLTKAGKTVVAAIVGDHTSGIDFENTERTLISLTNVASDIYLPTILATNDSDDRTDTDAYMIQQVSDLIRLLKVHTREVDRNDRLTWLNPSRTVSVDTGIHMLYVDSATAIIPAASGLTVPGIIHDSVLSLGVPAVGDKPAQYITEIGAAARFRKVGQIAPDSTYQSPLIGIITTASTEVDTLVDKIAKKRAFFNSQSNEVKTKVVVDKTKLDKSGYAF